MATSWTTTSDFDTRGTKSSSSGNYELETITDNGSNTANCLCLANRSGDMFNFADADGLTWKWQDGGSIGAIDGRDIDTTTNDTLYMKTTMAGVAKQIVSRTNSTLTGNFDIRVNISATWENGNQFAGFRVYISATDYVVIYMRKLAAGTYTLISTTSIGGVAGTTTTTSWTDYNLSFRIVRTADAVTTYYDTAGGDSWTQHRAVASGFSTNAGSVDIYTYHGVTNGSTYLYATNFRCDTATWS